MPKGVQPVDSLVGRNIRVFRLHRGITQEVLAQAIGVTFQQVQKYEKGANRVGSSRLAKIAEVLQVPIKRFFEGTPSQPHERDDLSELLANSYAVRMLKAFAQITREDVRRSMVLLAEAVAKEEVAHTRDSRRSRREVS